MFRSKALLLVVCSQWLKGKMAPIRITARQRDNALKTTSVYHLCLVLRRNELTSRFIPLQEEPLLLVCLHGSVIQNKINSLPFPTFFPSEKRLDLWYDTLNKETGKLLGKP